MTNTHPRIHTNTHYPDQHMDRLAQNKNVDDVECRRCFVKRSWPNKKNSMSNSEDRGNLKCTMDCHYWAIPFVDNVTHTNTHAKRYYFKCVCYHSRIHCCWWEFLFLYFLLLAIVFHNRTIKYKQNECAFIHKIAPKTIISCHVYDSIHRQHDDNNN